MKIINKKTFATIASFALLVFPVVAWAQVGIPCGDIAGGQKECGFNDLIKLGNNIIKFLMLSVAVPLAALGFMYTGGRLVLMPAKEGEWTAAKKRFGDLAMGFGIMLGAYVLIKTVLFAFLNDKDAGLMQLMNFIFQ